MDIVAQTDLIYDIMGYNTKNNELNVPYYTIDYNERKRLIDHNSSDTFIIPSATFESGSTNRKI